MSEPCATCGGTGFEIREGGDGVAVSLRCACSVRDRADQILRAARIPRRYEHCALDNFDIWKPELRPALEPPLMWAREWFERWPLHVDVGLLFMGPPGTGKTHLAVGLLRELAARKGAKIYFSEQRELLKELQSSFDGGSGRTESDVLAPILEAEVLLLDDLGAGRTSAWAQDVMHDVLAHRYNRKLPTLLTTNRAIGDDEPPSAAGRDVPTLRDRLGDALISRIYEMCRVIPVAGEDFRRGMLHAGHHF
jgi:DNA replication protein DnaC